MTKSQLIKDSDIAIIGMSCRFPGAANIDEFWQNLRDGVESISFFSDEELMASGIEPAIFKQPNYVKAGAALSNVDLFDAAFFDFSPREAEITDPQHRIFLECAWDSLENAGYALQNGDNIIGVYAGVSMNTYLLNNLYPNRDTLTETYPLMLGNDKDFLPTRVSYKLNLRGPSINVQTACSTSLVAVHLACQSLLNGECDITLAGGVSITLPQKAGYLYQEGMISSPDGHCRVFDAKAKGTVGGDGVGIVVLKRLEQAIADGDHIHAVIKGSAVNNDGFLKVGYTAPGVDGQTAVISEAQAIADIEAERISYIEAHGTGTELGDPIEIAALTKAFRGTTDKKGFCAIGSLKTNIGHTEAAAGVAGLIKTVLALKHRLLPASLHFEQPNPQIDFANSPFYVNRTLSEWKSNGTPRYAGVSSFGIGGTNAHVIVEESPAIEPSDPSRPWQLLTLSAKTESALDTATANLAAYLEQHPGNNLADVAYTLHCGRRSFKYRRMLVCQESQEAAGAFRALDQERVFTCFQPQENRSVLFMFSGQGAQYINMAYELYQAEPTFREEVDKCSDYLNPHLGLDLRQILYPGKDQIRETTEQINQTAITQTALFVIEYALAKLWMSYGIHPEAMIGHSIGEYVAACLADVFSLEDALSLVSARGRMMQSLPEGAMLAVLLPESEVLPLLSKELSLAAVNNPRRCVVSGFTEAVEALQNQLTQRDVECRLLRTSHAFHSGMMEPILDGFTNQVKQVKLNPPRIPYVSNVTGNWITASEATNPKYWGDHLRQTVRFAEGLEQVLEDKTRILLEVGPGRTLSTFAKQHPGKVAEHNVLSSLRHPQDNGSDVAFLLNTLGRLWLVGAPINWLGFYGNERRKRLPLPTYPFERQRYWIDPPKSTDRQVQDAAIPKSPWQSMIEAARKQAETGPFTLDNFISDYSAKRRLIDDLSLAYMNLALRELGAFRHGDEKFQEETFCRRFNIDPRYQQLVHHWLNVLVEKGDLQREGKSYTRLSPLTKERVNTLLENAQRQEADAAPLLNNLQSVGENLATVLRGEKEPRELFLTDNQDIPEKSVPEEYSIFTYYNGIIRICLEEVVKLLPTTVKLRILEIGAGTGITTGVVLPMLPAEQTHYTFTDISQFFLSQAQQKFNAYPFVSYRLLNLNQSPLEQGYEPQSFDVVMATLSLHVTQNVRKTLKYMRSLLAPGGLFFIWEITEPRLDFAIVEGLVMEPLEDGERNQGHPFLSREQWHEALGESGFVEVKNFPERDVLGFHVFVTKAEFPNAAFTNLLEQTENVNADPASLQTHLNSKHLRSKHLRSKQLGHTYTAPINDIEKKIADLWQEMLGIASVGIYDNFFELGGDSLIAVQLLARLRETLQIDLPAHSLLNAPTITALVEMIEETRSAPSKQSAGQALPAPLVVIKAGNPLKRPLFLTHPIGGHLYYYRELAEHLDGELPIYGLEVQGSDGKTEPLTQVEEMATLYIKALRILQPEGPYFLGGSSFGGTLAFEMAQQFRALGQKVALLAMIDTPGPGYMPDELKDDAEILAYMLKLGFDISVSLAELRRLGLDEQIDYSIKQIKMTNKELHGLNQINFRTVLKLFKTNTKAMRDYTPGIYSGKILFFRAKERDAYIPHNPELAWLDLALEGTELHIIPGNHMTMLSPPHVRFLAKRLEICIEQTNANYLK